MRLIQMLCIVALMAMPTAPALVMGGCSITQDHPTQTVKDAGIGYLAITRTLSAARRDGLIDRDTWLNQINPVIQEGREIYHDLRTATDAGDLSRAQVLEAVLSGIVSRLHTYEVPEEGDEP